MSPYRIEKRGTDYAPWCIVHIASGMTVPVSRPYPGEQPLPPIQVANHRSRSLAELAASEIDWDRIERIAATPEFQVAAARERERRAFDAAYQKALKAAREGSGPWPWEPGGLTHVGSVQALPEEPQTRMDLAA